MEGFDNRLFGGTQEATNAMPMSSYSVINSELPPDDATRMYINRLLVHQLTVQNTYDDIIHACGMCRMYTYYVYMVLISMASVVSSLTSLTIV